MLLDNFIFKRYILIMISILIRTMKRVNWQYVIALFFLFPSLSLSWNALGHKVIAKIAYENAGPATREKINSLVQGMGQQYTNIHSFEDLACWPDQIRGQKIESYTHWHYIDFAFSLDGASLKDLIDTDNAVWAVNKIEPVIQNAKANFYERTRFLAFYAHIISDLHQPLHTVSLISTKLPDGDQGGNSYHIVYQNKKSNLHSLWDAGVGVFSGINNKEHANEIADQLMRQYPENYFQNKLTKLNPEDWVQEGLHHAKATCYNTPYEGKISEQYIEKGQRLAGQQAALAGYRLAKLLDQIFAASEQPLEEK